MRAAATVVRALQRNDDRHEEQVDLLRIGRARAVIRQDVIHAMGRSSGSSHGSLRSVARRQGQQQQQVGKDGEEDDEMRREGQC